MRIDHAIEVIGRISYKAGWRITTRRTYGARAEHDVHLLVEYLAPDSSRENAPHYRRTVEVRSGGIIDVSTIGSDLDLLRKVLDYLIEVETHEAREFLRYGTDLEAPFHPHSRRGDDAWNLTKYGHSAGLHGLAPLLGDL